MFFQEAALTIRSQVRNKPIITENIKVVITAYPPDRRKRDIDNLCKATLDCLEKSQVIQNDNQVRSLNISFADIIKNGKVEIEIYSLPL
jgi:crossover junction endodeoxyribonuclease RusA